VNLSITKHLHQLSITCFKNIIHKGKIMTNPFRDSTKFMTACEQSTTSMNDEQFRMYANLITEEYDELRVAIANKNAVETLDALIDILVVTIGAINSMGADGEGAWKEVMSTNFNKIDRRTGKVQRREDGKVLKPEGWHPPELAKFLTRKQQ
jgi:predicted HAD superfamily Cof-like phosphohydrolase